LQLGSEETWQERVTRLAGLAANGIGATILYSLVFVIVIGLTLISGFAVVTAQLEAHPGEQIGQFYAVMFALILGFEVIALPFVSRRLNQGAYGMAVVILALWMAALPLVSYQEFRFHELQNSAVDQDAAPVSAERTEAQQWMALNQPRIDGFASTVTRSAAAVEAEYNRFKVRPNYQTKTAQLKAELEDARAYEALLATMAEKQAVLTRTAGAAVENTSAKKLGVEYEFMGFKITEAVTLWWMIMLMAGIRSFSMWALLGEVPVRKSKRQTPPLPLVDVQEPPAVKQLQEELEGDDTVVSIGIAHAEAVEPQEAPVAPPRTKWEVKTDKHGNRRRVRVRTA